MGSFDELIWATRVQRIKAPQAHPVPAHPHAPNGPFPPELTEGNPASEPKMVVSYEQAYPEDGSNLAPGTTAQNKFKSPKWLRCGSCFARVKEDETQDHVCDEISDYEDEEYE
jgi:hypothetical protein